MNQDQIARERIEIEDNDESQIGTWLLRERPRARLNRILTSELTTRESPELDDIDLRIRSEVLGIAQPYKWQLFPTFPIEKFRPKEPPKLFHIYGPAGPDVLTPNPDTHYAHVWVHSDQPPPNGSAGTNVREGKFHAGQYSTNGYFQALAGIGVRFKPVSDWCRFSIRPYVRFDGASGLRGRTYDIPGPPAWASAYGSVGIYVESWARTGGSHHIDEDHPVVLWDHSAPNPRNARSYEDVVTIRDGLTVDVFGSNLRRYKVWVYCWIEVVGQSLLQATAYASSSISCWMPFLVIEEFPA